MRGFEEPQITLGDNNSESDDDTRLEVEEGELFNEPSEAADLSDIQEVVEPNFNLQENLPSIIIKRLSKGDLKTFTKAILPMYHSTPKRRSSRVRAVPNRLKF